MSKLLITVVAGVMLFTVSCLQNNGQIANETAVRKTLSPEESNSTVVNSANSTVPAKDIEILRKFAESYEPRSSKSETIPSTPVPDERLSKALAALSQTQTKEHEKYIVLIFLRLHRFQVEKFKQSYALGDNQLAREFYLLIGENYQPGREPKLSYLAENWVKKNPKLLEYALIENEMKRIKNAEEKIEAELQKTINQSK